MALSPGARLGPYEIVAPLGAGGMGEVYRAKDTRLGRFVAIKILPPHLSADAGRRQRFEREARAIAAINHPNICTLYDVGQAPGTGPQAPDMHYLVMELVEGESLADRLLKGPLTVEDVLALGAEIAEALATAHRRGIVHRDLKPGNIMVTKTGGAKLLDFGLAKAQPFESTASDATTRAQPVTEEGTILGTFQYMAPEQLEGREADERSDIFALGAVLYEMATGRKAFEGQGRASLIAAILEKEPPSMATSSTASSDRSAASPPPLPTALDRLVRTALAKAPDRRWQSAFDIGLQLRWLASPGALEPSSVAAPASARRSGRERLAWSAFALSALGLVGVAGWWLLRPAAAPPPLQRFALQPPDGAAFAPSSAGTAPFPALSPDGSTLAFVAQRAGEPPSLWVRALDALDARPLPGTGLGTTQGNVGLPFWSPDGRSLGFFGEGKLKRIDLDTNAISVLCDAPQPNGGAWGPDGTIIFSLRNNGGLLRIAAAGGMPLELTTPAEGEFGHYNPSFLPDGRRFLYWVRSATPSIWAGSLDSNDRTRLFEADSRATYVAPGYLLFIRQTTLVAQRFDATRLTPLGDPTPLAEHVRLNALNGRAAFSVSSNGVLVYRTGDVTVGPPLCWFDRSGRLLAAVRNSEGSYQNFRLARDERRVVANFVDSALAGEIWTIDLDRGVRTRVTFDPREDTVPVWSPDGAWVAFRSNRAGPGDIYRKRAGGVGDDELLVKSDAPKWPTDWSAHWIVFAETAVQHKNDIWVTPADGSARARPYLQTRFTEGQARLSPDERWMAYTSDETGDAQVYVRPFPDANLGKWRISDAEGGRLPVWRADGRELFYVSSSDKVTVVSVGVKGSEFEAGAPRVLFQLPRLLGMSTFDISRDGSRIIAVTRPDERPTQQSVPLTVVLNWTRGINP